MSICNKECILESRENYLSWNRLKRGPRKWFAKPEQRPGISFYINDFCNLAFKQSSQCYFHNGISTTNLLHELSLYAPEHAHGKLQLSGDGNLGNENIL